MSETEQRETEYIAGVIEGITQKGPDKWQVAVKPDGSQYSKNLWTKDGELVTTLSAKIGAHGGFVCGVSHWTNNEGKPIRSLWIDSHEQADVSDLHVQAKANASPSTAPPANRQGVISTEGMTPEKWDAKDSAIHYTACIKAAAEAMRHTVPSEPTKEDLQAFSERVRYLAETWHRQVLVVRDGLPFDPALERDLERIPF